MIISLHEKASKIKAAWQFKKTTSKKTMLKILQFETDQMAGKTTKKLTSCLIKLAVLRENLSSGFLTRSDTNRAVPQRVARGLNFFI